MYLKRQWKYRAHVIYTGKKQIVPAQNWVVPEAPSWQIATVNHHLCKPANSLYVASHVLYETSVIQQQVDFLRDGYDAGLGGPLCFALIKCIAQWRRKAALFRQPSRSRKLVGLKGIIKMEADMAKSDLCHWCSIRHVGGYWWPSLYPIRTNPH